MSAHVRCGQAAGWNKILFGTEVGLSPGNFVLNGDPAPSPSPSPKKRGHSPQFSTHVYCGKTAGWIKMSLGMEIGVGSGDIVLDGGPAPPHKKRGTAPNFRPMSIVAKRSPISATAELLLLLSYVRRSCRCRYGRSGLSHLGVETWLGLPVLSTLYRISGTYAADAAHMVLLAFQ